MTRTCLNISFSIESILSCNFLTKNSKIVMLEDAMLRLALIVIKAIALIIRSSENEGGLYNKQQSVNMVNYNIRTVRCKYDGL